jgi:hypothetical protein
MKEAGREREEKVDLRVRTKQFGLRVIRLFSALPESPIADVIGRQVLRSGTSVGANFREAYRSRSNAEFVSKVGDCLKELVTGWNCSWTPRFCRPNGSLHSSTNVISSSQS